MPFEFGSHTPWLPWLIVAFASEPFPAAQETPLLWDPPAVTVHPDHGRVARDASLLPGLIADGEALFRTRFNRLDGAGRPGATGDSKPTPRARRPETLHRISGPEADSCAGCHNQPSAGGSGDSSNNVFVGAHFAAVPLDRIGAELTSERSTPGMFGAGWIEVLASEMTRDLRSQREMACQQAVASGMEVGLELHAKGVSFGRLVARADGTCDQSGLEGVDDDLVVRPFGAKGVACSLREFTIAALNQHHGIQAIERFGWERTGRVDFDEDGVLVEATVGQVTALVLFQASLSPPPRPWPSLLAARASGANGAGRPGGGVGAHARVGENGAALGEELFTQVGCGDCHVPSLILEYPVFSEPNAYNRPGTLGLEDEPGVIRMPLQAEPGTAVEELPDGRLRVWLYSDLRRHVVSDAGHPHFGNERLRQDNVPTDQFMTPRLWDLARSAPYGHRGHCSTISEAILHHGGEAGPSRRRFERLSDEHKRALVAFLLSLGSE